MSKKRLALVALLICGSVVLAFVLHLEGLATFIVAFAIFCLLYVAAAVAPIGDGLYRS